MKSWFCVGLSIGTFTVISLAIPRIGVGASVSVNLSNVSIQEALSELQAKTGIEISLDPQLRAHGAFTVPVVVFNYEGDRQLDELEHLIEAMFRFAAVQGVCFERGPRSLRVMPYDLNLEVAHAFISSNARRLAELLRRHNAALPLLLALVVDGKQPTTCRLLAIDVIAAAGEERVAEEAVGPLAALVADASESERIRVKGTSALGQLGDEAAASVLVPFLGDDNDEVRCQAAHSLAKVGSASSIAPLLESLDRTAPNSRFAGEVISSLGELGAEKALPALTTLTGDPEVPAYTRKEAAVAVEKIHLLTSSSSRIDAATRALRSSSPAIRVWGIKFIAQSGDIRYVPHLRRALEGAEKEEQMGVYSAAVNALERLGVDIRVQGLLNNSLYMTE